MATKKKVVNPAAKKPAAKKPAAKKEETPKKVIKRVPPRIVKKVVAPPKPVEEEFTPIDTAKAVAFAMSIAQEMKRSAAMAEEQRANDEIRLSRRPTTRTKGKTTQQFPEADLEKFRLRLIMLRQEALGQSTTLRTVALEQTDDRGSEDDDGSDAFMRLQNLKQVDTQSRIVQQIDEALARINDGTYGICEVCGQLIRKPRLMNLPFVHTCMECQPAMEKPFGSR